MWIHEKSISTLNQCPTLQLEFPSPKEMLEAVTRNPCQSAAGNMRSFICIISLFLETLQTLPKPSSGFDMWWDEVSICRPSLVRLQLGIWWSPLWDQKARDLCVKWLWWGDFSGISTTSYMGMSGISQNLVGSPPNPLRKMFISVEEQWIYTLNWWWVSCTSDMM